MPHLLHAYRLQPYQRRLAVLAYTHHLSDARPRRESEAASAQQRYDVHSFSLESHKGCVNGVFLHQVMATRYRGSSAVWYLLQYVFFTLKAAVLLLGHHIYKPWDVIHVHTMPDFLVWAAWPLKVCGVRVVLDMHDTTPELYQSKFNLPSTHVLIRALRAVERLSASCAHHVLAVHPPHKQLLVSRGVPSSHVSVVMNVPDPSLVRRGTLGVFNPQAPVFAYHGTVARRLGVDLLVHAFAQVLARIPQARLKIIGTGDDAAHVCETIQRCGVQHAVVFPNQHMPLEKLIDHLQDVSVGVVSNRDEPSTRWMLPVKLLEYMQWGIPCVVPRLPVVLETVGSQAGVFYAPEDVTAMAEAMFALATSKQSWDTQRHEGLQWSDTHGWASQRQTLLDVLQGSSET